MSGLVQNIGMSCAYLLHRDYQYIDFLKKLIFFLNYKTKKSQNILFLYDGKIYFELQLKKDLVEIMINIDAHCIVIEFCFGNLSIFVRLRVATFTRFFRKSFLSFFEVL